MSPITINCHTMDDKTQITSKSSQLAIALSAAEKKAIFARQVCLFPKIQIFNEISGYIRNSCCFEKIIEQEYQ